MPKATVTATLTPSHTAQPNGISYQQPVNQKYYYLSQNPTQTHLETYDNLTNGNYVENSAQGEYNSTTSSKAAQYNYFERYKNSSLRPMYSSMRVPNNTTHSRNVKSIDHDLMLYYESLNQEDLNALNQELYAAEMASIKKQPPSYNRASMLCDNVSSYGHGYVKQRHSLFASPLVQTHSRDIKSCEREMNVPTAATIPSSQGLHVKQNRACSMTPVYHGAYQQQTQNYALRNFDYEDDEVSNVVTGRNNSIVNKKVKKSSNESKLTSRKKDESRDSFSIINTSEEDEKTTTNIIKGGGDVSSKNNSETSDFVLLNELDTECDAEEETSRNGDATESFESSKLKMKQMQKQLEQLTNLVNQALINRDLNQLASIVTSQYNIETTIKNNERAVANKQANTGCGGGLQIDNLNEKTKLLKNDLQVIKKMQANLKDLFGDSMKGFVIQLNVNIFYQSR